jgi:ribosome-dependent ATPase
MALLGSLVLMFVISYGITHGRGEPVLRRARPRPARRLSQNYALNLSGSRYFIERPPIVD